MSELKVFTFGLGRYTEDGYPCVVAVDGEGNPRLASDEEFYLKSEADKVIAEQDAEIAQLQAMLEERNKQVGELKEMMPEYKQFIKDKKFKKELVDEYDGYVYEWAGHRYIATPYINIFIKGILRTLYKAIANWAKSERYTEATWHGDEHREELWAEVQHKCLKKAEEFGG